MPQQSLLRFSNKGVVKTMTIKTPTKARCKITLTISSGNAKMGQVWHISLPWKETCPGRSQFCEQFCYVRNRNFSPSIQRIYQNNYKITQLPNFADQMIEVLQATQLQWKKGQTRIFRWHPSGDFYSVKYIEDWIQIAKTLSDWQFYGYTHSWNCDLESTLRKLQALPNVSLYASMDETMEEPPSAWELRAWMSYEKPEGVCRCQQEQSLKIEAFKIWKKENHKPMKWSADPGKDELRRVAIRHSITPLFCLDCRYCIQGVDDVWFKMRTNPMLNSLLNHC